MKHKINYSSCDKNTNSAEDATAHGEMQTAYSKIAFIHGQNNL